MKPEKIFKDAESYVYIKRIGPLSFKEFLIVNQKNTLAQAVESHKERELTQSEVEELKEKLKEFFLVGGMPEIVKVWIETEDFEEVDRAKKRLVASYEDQFRKIKNKALQKKVFEIWKIFRLN